MNLGSLISRFSGGASPAPAPVPAPEETGDAPEILSVVRERYAYSRAAKQSKLETWATCLAFYMGEQWRKWDRESRRLVRRERLPSWRVQIVDNQIPGILDVAAAKQSRSRQIPRALPNTDEDEDRRSAELGSSALKHWWTMDDFETKELELNLHRLIFGAGFVHDYWDPAIEQRMAVPTPEGGMRAVRAPVGDVRTEILSVFDVFPEPVERFSDASWVIIAKRKPVHWIRETFSDRGGEIVPDQGDHHSALSFLLPSFNSGAAPPDGDGEATLLCYYEAPSKRYPAGRHAVIAGQTLLYSAEKLPMPHGEIPVTISLFRLVPKSMWGLGLVETMLGQQEELNRGQSNFAELFRLHRSPKWLAPRECGLDTDALTSEPGEVLEYDARSGLSPGYLMPPPLPAWIVQYPDLQREAMRHLSGQREMSPQGIPSGVTAASALGIIEEQNNIRLSTPARLGKDALERVAKHVLITIAERYREPRLISTFGRGRTQDVVSLLGSDIGDRDVTVDLTEGVADTDAVRTQQIAEWMNGGLLQIIGTPVQVVLFRLMRDSGQGWLADSLESAIEEIEEAQQEAAAQQMGQPPPGMMDEEGVEPPVGMV